MQYLFNFWYYFISFISSSLNFLHNFHLPSSVVDPLSDVFQIFIKANYFVPVSLFFELVLVVIGYQLFLMMLSALLQLL